jgi:transposase
MSPEQDTEEGSYMSDLMPQPARTPGHRPPSLTDEQVLAARELVDQGASISEVARRFNVSRVTIHRSFERLHLPNTEARTELVALRKFRATVTAATERYNRALSGIPQ